MRVIFPGRYNIPCRRQVSGVQASDVVLVDIVASGMNGVEFSMFVLTSDSSAVLDQQALLQAVQVSIIHYSYIIIIMYNFLIEKTSIRSCDVIAGMQ